MIATKASQRKQPQTEYSGAGDPKAIAEYLVSLGDDLRSGRKTGWLPATNKASIVKPQRVFPMNWNSLTVPCREVICNGAAISTKIARQQWEQLEPWLQFMLAEAMLMRSHGYIALRGDNPVAWETNPVP